MLCTQRLFSWVLGFCFPWHGVFTETRLAKLAGKAGQESYGRRLPSCAPNACPSPRNMKKPPGVPPFSTPAAATKTKTKQNKTKQKKTNPKKQTYYNLRQSLFTWRRLQVVQGQGWGLWGEGKVFAGLLEKPSAQEKSVLISALMVFSARPSPPAGELCCGRIMPQS